MAITVYSCPAYDVVEMEGYFVAGDEVSVSLPGKRSRSSFTFGSVMSYALKTNRDPIEAYERDKARGHHLYWLTPHCVSITSHQRERKVYRNLEVGRVIQFEGKNFRVDVARNDNLKLVEV
jgi:hypothetical protein